MAPTRNLGSLLLHLSPSRPSASASASAAALVRRAHSASSSPSAPFSSVSPAEVAHFDALASSWWDPHGPSRILHLMNPIRHDFIRSCRAASPADSTPTRARDLRYLDVGCGGGIFAESAARLATTTHVTGIDPSPGVLAVARAHAQQDPALFPSSNNDNSDNSDNSNPLQSEPSPATLFNRRHSARLRYLPASIEALPRPAAASAQYDTVTMFEVLEHVSSPSTVLAHAAPFVRLGGWLVMSTIARTWASWLTTKLLAEHVLRVVPRGTHSWDKYISAHELRAMLLSPGAEAAGGNEDLAEGRHWRWGNPTCMGVMYVPGLGWREALWGEQLGNYFLAVRKELT